jgi:hypothetical protein
MGTRAILAATALCIGAAASVRAHHSHAMFYDPCKSLTIEGRVERVTWKQPHILFDVTLDDGTLYHAEWMGLRELTTRDAIAPAQDALTFGARVVVTGNLLRDPAQIRASVPAFTDSRGPNLLDVAQIRRVDNSWTWRGESPTCRR